MYFYKYWHAHRSKQSQEWREVPHRTDESLVADEIVVKWNISDYTWTFLDKLQLGADNKDIQANHNTHWSRNTLNSDSDAWRGRRVLFTTTFQWRQAMLCAALREQGRLQPQYEAGGDQAVRGLPFSWYCTLTQWRDGWSLMNNWIQSF